MPISKFKATCLGVMETVRKTGQPILVTRFGKPIARVLPPAPAEIPVDWMGSLASDATLNDDLIESVSADDEWDAFK